MVTPHDPAAEVKSGELVGKLLTRLRISSWVETRCCVGMVLSSPGLLRVIIELGEQEMRIRGGRERQDLMVGRLRLAIAP